jgi:hypothetical protein
MPLFVAGCASSYRPVNPNGFPYGDAQHVGDSLRVSYVTDIQRLTQNKRYATKELKRGMKAVGIKIENISDRKVRITQENLRLFSHGVRTQILSPEQYAKKVKQRVGAHLLHALYGPWAISWSEDARGETDVDFIYIPVGAIIGIGNAIRADNANKANIKTLQMNSIWGKEIGPHETLYGLVPVMSTGDAPLEFTLIKE